MKPDSPNSPDSAKVADLTALRWIPLDPNQLLPGLLGLTDYQVGWFFRIYLACLTSTPCGYLLADAVPLWRVAGASTESFFLEKSAAILSAFGRSVMGGKQYLFHPQLQNVIAEQLAKIKKKRRRGTIPTQSTLFTNGENCSYSSSHEVTQSLEKPSPNYLKLATTILKVLQIPGSPQLMRALESAIEIETVRRPDHSPEEAARYLSERVRLYQAIKHRIWNLATFVQDGRYRDEPLTWENGNGRAGNGSSAGKRSVSACYDRRDSNVPEAVTAIQIRRARKAAAAD